MENKSIKLGFIGAGKMATAIMNGIIKSNFMKRSDIFAYDINCDALKNMKDELKINTTSEIKDIIENCDVILLSVKPFVFNDVAKILNGKVENKLIISILAGITTEKIEKNLGENVKVIRVMPNTPALVAQGMSAICKGKNASEEERDFVSNMLENIGETIKTEEKYIDIITAISGSGPAFYYYFIEEIARAGEKLGLDYETCLKLSAQTALGSAKMILEGLSNGLKEGQNDVKQLIKNVTTPGGCTEVGNEILKEFKVNEILDKTISETMKKAKSLG